ncbi:hypothetical protein AnigIFM63604_001443 [Aspergillus niger]|uniref:Uncharacterized protein n=1 Tax=Aspergillus niger TaxID=5061 RepID=A0A9W5ZT97_ASPNG|nr:hypothetical protein AnigIFM63604_001443 [Aspergillus niger]
MDLCSICPRSLYNKSPFVLVLVVAVMLNGALMAQLGYYMPWYLVGACLAFAGSALFNTVGPDNSSARLYEYSMLTAFDIGCHSQAGSPIAQVKASPGLLSQAVAFIGTIAYTIFLNKSTGRIAAILPQQPGDIIQQAIFGVRAEFFTSLSVVQRKRVVAAIISSVDDVFVLMIAAAALSVVLALVMKWERLFVGSRSPQGDDGEAKEAKEGLI